MLNSYRRGRSRGARALVCPALLLCAVSLHASDWVTFQHDARHSGISADKEIAVPLNVRWQFTTNGPVRAQAVIKAGVVYFGSLDHKFYALDAKSGELKWSFIAGGEIHATASLDETGGVYFGCDDGFVYALDAVTGALRWTSPICRTPPPPASIKLSYWRDAYKAAKKGKPAPPKAQEEPDGFRPPHLPDSAVSEGGSTKPTALVIRAPVLAAHGMVFVGAGLAGSWGYLHGFDAGTGELRWKKESGWPGARRMFGGAENGPVLYNETLFWPSYQHQIMAYEPTSGKTPSNWPEEPKPMAKGQGHWPRVYQIKTGSQMAVNKQGLAAVAGPSLGYSQKWVVVDLSNHQVINNRVGPPTGIQRCAPLLKGKLLYSTEYRASGERPTLRTPGIVCVDVTTRKKRGTITPTVPAGEPFNRCLAMAGGLIFGATGDGRICAFREDLGKQEWTFDLKTPCQATGAIADGMYFIGAEDGRMTAFGK